MTSRIASDKMGGGRGGGGVSLPILIDRLITAADAVDARSSLEEIKSRVAPITSNAATTTTTLATPTSSTIRDEERHANIRTICTSLDCLRALFTLLGTTRLPEKGVASGSSGLEVDGGYQLSCEILLHILQLPPSNPSAAAAVIPSNTDISYNSSSNKKNHLSANYLRNRNVTPERQYAKLLLSSHTDNSSNNNNQLKINDLSRPLSSTTALPPSLVSSALDLLCTSTNPTYPRILSMQLLQLLIQLQPFQTQDCLLLAPDGMNRLIDLLTIGGGGGRGGGGGGDDEEVIRNEAIVMLITLSHSSAAIRQLLIFGEGFEKALSIATRSEMDDNGAGGLLTSGGGGGGSGSATAAGVAGGKIVLLDCLQLCCELSRDEGGAELLVSSRSAMNKIGLLLDTRLVYEVLHPIKDAGVNEESSKQVVGMSMEDLLRDYADGKSAVSSRKSNKEQKKELRKPILNVVECNIIQKTLDLLHFVIGDDNGTEGTRVRRRMALSQHDDVCSLIISLALHCEQVDEVRDDRTWSYVAGAPSEAIQSSALDLLSIMCSSVLSSNNALGGASDKEEKDIDKNQKEVEKIRASILSRIPMYNPNLTSLPMNAPGGMVECLVTVCRTSSSIPTVVSAMTALQIFLTEEVASLMVMHTRAPPPELEATSADNKFVSPVKKTMDSLAQHLISMAFVGTQSEETAAHVVGTCGVLGIFLKLGGDMAKEMLIRAALDISLAMKNIASVQDNECFLLNIILKWMAKITEKPGATKHFVQNDKVLSCTSRSSVERLLCEWIDGSGETVRALLELPESVCIADMMYIAMADKEGGNDGAETCEAGFAALLLGICLEYVGNDDHAGWSRGTIMNVISNKVGASRFTALLETPRQSASVMANRFGLFGSTCWGTNDMQAKLLLSWYSDRTSVIRKRLVQQVTGSTSDEIAASTGDKSLASMVAHQQQEINRLNDSIHEAKTQLSLKETECKQWRKQYEKGSSLDDALSQQIEVAIEAQQVASGLRERLVSKDDEHKKEMEDKNKLIFQLQSDIGEARQDALSSREEATTMAEELQALSEAYSSLEFEFRRSSKPGERKQSIGEKSYQILATAPDPDHTKACDDIHALKEEIEEIKKSSQAAEDWMTMAVRKIEELGAENAELQNLVTISKDSKSIRDTDPDFLFEQALKRELAVAQTHCEDLTQKIRELQSSHADEKRECELLKRDAVLSTKLQADLDAMKAANDSAQEWMANAVSHHEHLNEQIDLLRSENEAFCEQLAAVTDCKEQTEKEAPVLDSVSLDQRLSAETEEIERLKIEITCLNESLRRENEADLAAKAKLAVETASEIASLKKKVESVDNELRIAREENAQLETQLTVENSNLRESLVEARDQILQLEDRVVHLSEREANCHSQTDLLQAKEGLQLQIDDLLKEQEDLTKLRDAALASEAELSIKLNEFQEWVETAQQRVAELEGEKSVVDERLKAREESERNWKVRKDELERDIENAVAERDQAVSKLNSLSARHDQLEIEACEKKDIYSQELSKLKESITRINDENKALKRKLSESDNQLKMDKSSMDARINDLQQQLLTSESEVGALSQKLKSAETAYEVEVDTVSQQSELIEGLELQIVEKKDEVGRAQIQIRSLEKELVQNEELRERETLQLKEELMAARLQMESAERHETDRSQRDAESIHGLEAQLKESEAFSLNAQQEIESLSHELNDVGRQSSDVVNQWKERSEELESTVIELQSTVLSLESTVEDLERTKEGQLSEAYDAISQWETRCATLTEQLAELHVTSSAENAGQLEAEITNLQQALLESQSSEMTLRQYLSAAQAEIMRSKEEADMRVNVVEEARVKIILDLNNAVASSETNANKLEEATSCIQSMKDEIASLETDCEEMKNQVSETMNGKGNVENENERLKTKVKQLEESFDEEKSRQALSEKALRNAQDVVEKKGQEWEQETRERLDRQRSAENEIASYHAVIGQLQGELRDAYEALQSRFTDEISTKATATATTALKSQLAEIRKHWKSEREEASQERALRLQIQREMADLKADLVFLAESGSESSEFSLHIKSLVSQASDFRARLERKEFEELKTSLEQALQNLALSRSSEHDAEERAASARLALLLTEKDILVLNEDVSLLTDTVERMQKQESQVLDTLNERLSSMKRDRDLLVESHKKQIMSLKSEVSQRTTENDKLSHSIHDLQEANSTLISTGVQVASKIHSTQEVVQLRIEKAHLLSLLSESASKMEVRIRGIIEAHWSASDAELLLEKDLRQAAEKSLILKQSQLDELAKKVKMDVTRAESVEVDVMGQSGEIGEAKSLLDDVDELTQRNNSLLSEAEKLRTDNVSLKSELADAKSENRKVLEKCRLAETKIVLEKEHYRFESEVVTEVTRLRSEAVHPQKIHGSPSPTTTLLETISPSGDRLAGDNPLDQQLAVEEMYDLIADLKATMKEERDMYREHLAQHDDLLALLAQQDLERASLQEALTNASGSDAVDEAIQAAKSRASDRFGEYVILD